MKDTERLEQIRRDWRTSDLGISLRDVEWLIQQAEILEQFAQKNIELNEFLYDYFESNHWGRNVIDVAMDIITKQAEQAHQLKEENRELKSAMIKVCNNVGAYPKTTVRTYVKSVFDPLLRKDVK